jgi:hypothetical protein
MLCSDARLIRLSRSSHYSRQSRDPCTNGQVFHRGYRENVAKTGAKVYISASYLLSVAYGITRLVHSVLAARFGAKNVTLVPSIFLRYAMSNRTGNVNMPNRAGSGIKGKYIQAVFGNRG